MSETISQPKSGRRRTGSSRRYLDQYSTHEVPIDISNQQSYRPKTSESILQMHAYSSSNALIVERTKSHPHEAHILNPTGSTILHALARNKAPLYVVKTVYKANPRAIGICNLEGNTPFEEAEKHHAPRLVINFLKDPERYLKLGAAAITFPLPGLPSVVSLSSSEDSQDVKSHRSNPLAVTGPMNQSMQGSSSNLTTDTGRFKNRRKAQSSSGVKNCRSKVDHHASKYSKQQGSKQQHQIMTGSRRTSHDIKTDTVTSTKSFDPVYLPNDDMDECNESNEERMQEEALERPKLPQHHRSTSEDVQSLMKSLLDLSHLHDTSDAELFGDEGLSSTYNNNNSTDGNSAIQVTVRDDIDQNSRDQQIESIPFLKRKIESLEHSLVTVSHKNHELDGALRSLSKSYTNLKKTMNYESEERTALQSRMYDIECNMQQLMEELTEEKKAKRIMNTRSSSSRI